MNRHQFFTQILPYLLLTLFFLILSILSACALTSTPAPTTISLVLPTSSPNVAAPAPSLAQSPTPTSPVTSWILPALPGSFSSVYSISAG